MDIGGYRGIVMSGDELGLRRLREAAQTHAPVACRHARRTPGQSIHIKNSYLKIVKTFVSFELT